MSAHEQRADEQNASNDLRKELTDAIRAAILESSNRSNRLSLWALLLTTGLIVILGYQTWLITRLNDQLTEQSTALLVQSSLMEQHKQELVEQNELLRGETSLLADQNRALATQNRTLENQSTLIAKQNEHLQTYNRLFRTQLRQFRRLHRRLEADAKRSVIQTLSNLQPCPGDASNANRLPAMCPFASPRARQEALNAYLDSKSHKPIVGRVLDLSNTRLDKLSLSKTDLRKADFEGATLSEADLGDTDVRGANFAMSRGLQRPSRWCFDEHTSFPAQFDPGRSDPEVCVRRAKGG